MLPQPQTFDPGSHGAQRFRRDLRADAVTRKKGDAKSVHHATVTAWSKVKNCFCFFGSVLIRQSRIIETAVRRAGLSERPCARHANWSRDLRFIRSS